MAYLFQSRKEPFQEEADRIRCNSYTPCPICFKCTARAVHIYKKCETCAIPICGHTEKDRRHLIKPKNFGLTATPDVEASIYKDYEDYLVTKANQA